MKQKCIHLSEEDVTLLNSIKKKYGFKSDGQTVSYLIHKHEQGFEELAVAVRKELEENYLPKRANPLGSADGRTEHNHDDGCA